MASNKTLISLLNQEKISSGDIRYLSDAVKEEIISQTSRCSGSFRERLFWLQNNLFDYPSCVVCGGKLTSKSFQTKVEGGAYNMHCSVKCAKRNTTLIEQQKETVFKKYGTEQYLSSRDAREKIENTNLTKHGSKSPAPWSSQEFKKNMLKKHGVENPRQIKDSNDKIIRNTIINNISTGRTELSIISCQSKKNVECLNVEEAMDPNRPRLDLIPLRWKHNICGSEYTSRIVDGDIQACPKCKNGVSILELSLRGMILEILDEGEEIEFNKRGILAKNKELDIFIPSKNIAIELNGIYWHSVLRNDNRYQHLEKTEECERRGIRLIHIWEHHFLNKNEIVKSILKNALGKSIPLSARKCKVKQLNVAEAKDFVQQNHINGWIPSKISIGLEYEGKLVSVMTFGKNRFKKNSSEWEIYRFCSILNYQVRGAASKLLKFFVKTLCPEKIMTYADRSLGVGNVYEKIGMLEKYQTKPSYFWANIISPSTLSRYQTQKHKLKKLLSENFDPNKSEAENMKSIGWFKIWDCGNKVYEINFT